MPNRKSIVGGNWKMNLHVAEVTALSQALTRRWCSGDQVDVVIFPPFPYLTTAGPIIANTSIQLGAQDFYPEPNGAFTGEVSLSMLQDVGVRVALVGHSERRHVMSESDTLVNRKLRAALDRQFHVVLCVGETIEQRQMNQAEAIIAGQTQFGLAGVDRGQMARVTIAYEPVWAIGTGQTATPGDAQAAHQTIRHTLAVMFTGEVADSTRIQYGGSVKPENAPDLIAQADVDGFLVGGASLKADEFLAIVEATAGYVQVSVTGSHLRGAPAPIRHSF